MVRRVRALALTGGWRVLYCPLISNNSALEACRETDSDANEVN